MKRELAKQAKSNLKKRKAYQVILTIYACVSIILFIISTQADPGTRFWINFPTLIFLCVLAIIYVSMFGFRPIREALNEEDDSLEREITRLYSMKTDGLQLREDVSIEDRLELLELEKLKEKLERE